jgi:hypothetical protein
MPVIKRTAPLLPEGEYVGQAIGVSQVWSKPKTNADGSTSKPYQMFKIPLKIPGGQSITTFARVLPSTGWIFEQIAKSGDLIVPEGEEFIVTTDDLERRKLYFGVRHTDYNGQKLANVNFHTKVYACQVNPSLENVSFPNEAPRGVHLRSASQPPPEAAGPVAPKEPAPVRPSAPVEATELPTEGLETLTDAEFPEALAYAKKRREKKD